MEKSLAWYLKGYKNAWTEHRENIQGSALGTRTQQRDGSTSWQAGVSEGHFSDTQRAGLPQHREHGRQRPWFCRFSTLLCPGPGSAHSGAAAAAVSTFPCVSWSILSVDERNASSELRDGHHNCTTDIGPCSVLGSCPSILENVSVHRCFILRPTLLFLFFYNKRCVSDLVRWCFSDAFHNCMDDNFKTW